VRWRTDGAREAVQPADGFGGADPANQKVDQMLYTIALILLVLWAVGLVSSYTLGGFIHLLLVIAVIMILVNLISGRKAM
jgi:uncharacterized membrane protein YtjA (UPF0391 family)